MKDAYDSTVLITNKIYSEVVQYRLYLKSEQKRLKFVLGFIIFLGLSLLFLNNIFSYIFIIPFLHLYSKYHNKIKEYKQEIEYRLDKLDNILDLVIVNEDLNPNKKLELILLLTKYINSK